MSTTSTHLISYLVLCAVVLSAQGCSPTYYSSEHASDESHDSGTHDGVGLEHIEERLGGEQPSGGDTTLHMSSNLSDGYNVEDSTGIKHGELNKKPGGGYTIENSIGKKIGELEPNPGGGYDIENQFGRDVGDVEPNHQGGYQIKDPSGRDVKRVDSDIGGGYDIKNISDEDR